MSKSKTTKAPTSKAQMVRDAMKVLGVETGKEISQWIGDSYGVFVDPKTCSTYAHKERQKNAPPKCMPRHPVYDGPPEWNGFIDKRQEGYEQVAKRMQRAIDVLTEQGVKVEVLTPFPCPEDDGESRMAVYIDERKTFEGNSGEVYGFLHGIGTAAFS